MSNKCEINHKTMPHNKLVLKLGGLYCPKCRIVIYAPYVDKEYKKELKRRQSKLNKLD